MFKAAIVSAAVVGTAVGGYALNELRKDVEFWKKIEKIRTLTAEIAVQQAEKSATQTN